MIMDVSWSKPPFSLLQVIILYFVQDLCCVTKRLLIMNPVQFFPMLIWFIHLLIPMNFITWLSLSSQVLTDFFIIIHAWMTPHPSVCHDLQYSIQYYWFFDAINAYTQPPLHSWLSNTPYCPLHQLRWAQALHLSNSFVRWVLDWGNTSEFIGSPPIFFCISNSRLPFTLSIIMYGWFREFGEVF